MNQGEVLIKVEGVSKKFCKSLKKSLWYGVQDITSAILGNPTSSDQLRRDEFWAVKEVGFEVRRGECLGLIGHNGAGKSTLLKMLNGLIRPDKGRIEIRGKVGALIELGAGFNPLLSGRENIYNNGAVLGFTKAEIDQKFDEVVAFAELEEFIDMPVQNYSSGMRVRLGFAIAAQMEPDVLLIDEVLAVGDMRFVIKCFNKMDFLLQNTAIILVSHNIPQIARMSNKLCILEKGKNIYSSENIGEGINLFYSKFSDKITNFESKNEVKLESIWIERVDGIEEKIDENPLVPYGAGIKLFIKIKSAIKLENLGIYLAFYDREQRNFGEVMNFLNGKTDVSLLAGQETIFCAEFSEILFSQGIYSITVGMAHKPQGAIQSLFRVQSAIYFQVIGGYHGWAPLQFKPKWSFSENLK